MYKKNIRAVLYLFSMNSSTAYINNSLKISLHKDAKKYQRYVVSMGMGPRRKPGRKRLTHIKRLQTIAEEVEPFVIMSYGCMIREMLHLKPYSHAFAATFLTGNKIIMLLYSMIKDMTRCK